MTLTNQCADSNFKVAVWLWDKSYKMVSMANVKLENVQSGEHESIPTSVSFNPDDPRSLVITGKHVYRYLKMNNNFQLQPFHERLIKKESSISTHFTCHAFIERRLIICTAEGDILLAENSAS